MQSNKKPFVSVVLPTYNESDNIGREIETIEAAMKIAGHPYEILIIDDGSTDDTVKIAESKGARVICHGKNQGGGAARNTGIIEAKGDIIVASDADGTYPHENIPKMLSYFPDADMVIGARTGKIVEEPWHRRFPKYLIRRMASSLSGIEIPDLNSGFRAFKKEIGRQYFSILPKTHSWASTITLALLCNGHPVVFMPINYYKRKGGKSTFSPLADTYSYILLSIRTVMFFNPLRVFLPIGFWTFILGATKATFDLFRTGEVGGADTFILISSMNIIILGFIADLLVVVGRRKQVPFKSNQ